MAGHRDTRGEGDEGSRGKRESRRSREAEDSRDDGAAAAMAYFRALRSDDGQVLSDADADPETAEIPLVVGAVSPRGAEGEAGVSESGVSGSGVSGSGVSGSGVSGSGVSGSGAAGAGVSGVGAPGAGVSGVGAAPVATATPSTRAPSLTEEWVTCPECGTSATVDLAQRRAEDFCPQCDFPLFWARSSIIAMAGDETGASLRRLPGTVGRAATASVACPHCGEPNSPIAEVCVRCGLPMVIVEPEPEPEPEPVYVAPEPEPEPEPEDPYPIGLVIAICLAIILIAVGLTLYYQFG